MKRVGHLKGESEPRRSKGSGSETTPAGHNSGSSRKAYGRPDPIQRSDGTTTVICGWCARPVIGARNGPSSGKTIWTY